MKEEKEMCEFLSAVKGKTKMGKDKWYFLTYGLIHNTPTGELLQKKYGGDDLIGHSAIREYFGLRSGMGENWECSNFYTAANFPAIIVRAIKRGEFMGFGEPKGLLKATAEKAYQEATAPAEKAYQEATAPAWKAYQEATAPAWKAYQEAKATAEKAYQEATAPAWKAYQEAKAPAEKAYQEAKATAFWNLFAILDNRSEAWK